MRKNPGRIFVCLLAAVVFIFSAISGAYAQEKQPYETVLETLKGESKDFYDPITQWKVHKKCDDRCLDPKFEGPKWKNANWGYLWPELDSTIYFKKTYTVPEKVAGRDIAGSKVYLFLQVENDAKVYVDGKFAGLVHRSGEALIGENITPGSTINITMTIENKRDIGLMRFTSVRYSKLDELKNRTSAFITQVESVVDFLEYADDRDKWIGILNQAAGKVDLDAYGNQDDAAFFASLDSANKIFGEFAPFFKDYDVYLTGYSHIDLAWLWDLAEGEDVTRNTALTMFRLMDEFPNFVYTQTQAQTYKWMEEDYPEVFDEIQKWYKEGRWEVTGGTWSEHDSNVPSGEGFVRQFLYGKRYFRDKFNKDIVVAWTPDSFGYNWNLPQFVKKSGCIGFLTQKINWNDTTRFPHNIFWWEGPDGSRVLTYFPVGGYGEYVDGSTILNQMKRIIEKHNVKENYVIFGIGDHGGGATRGHLERAQVLENNPAYPNVHYVTGEEYFTHLLNDVATDPEAKVPVWNDELYLEYHRGTYTTQANTKKNNRELEILMENAEKYAALTNLFGLSEAYPSNDIFDGWRIILVNHMHDILPGSGIRAVYEDADRDYAKTRKLGNAILNQALNDLASDIDTSGAGVPIILFNPLSWERDGVVQMPIPGLAPGAEVIAPDGNRVPCQLVDDSNGAELLFVARKVPAGGHAVYHILPAGSPAGAPGTRLTISDGSLENEFLKVAYDVKSGHVTSIKDKLNGNRESLSEKFPSNVIQVYEDWPTDNDAWNIALGQERRLDRAGDAEIVEAGPVRVTAKITYRVGISTFNQYISLVEGMPLLYGRIVADWQERHNMAKLAFNFNIDNDTVWYNIPYAAIPRKSVPQTPAERAKWEHSGQRWVDYSEKDASYGVTLVNANKYGYDANNNTLRMSLLRSPTSPDPLADRGAHDIAYALSPHAGAWQDGDAPRAGDEFNYPLIPLITTAHEGGLPPSASLFRTEQDNVTLAVIKKAEDDDDIVIRIVETEGRDTTATITLPFLPETAAEVNLIEDAMDGYDPIKIEKNRITVPLGHYEIKTIKLKKTAAEK